MLRWHDPIVSGRPEIFSLAMDHTQDGFAYSRLCRAEHGEKRRCLRCSHRALLSLTLQVNTFQEARALPPTPRPAQALASAPARFGLWGETARPLRVLISPLWASRRSPFRPQGNPFPILDQPVRGGGGGRSPFPGPSLPRCALCSTWPWSLRSWTSRSCSPSPAACCSSPSC